MNNDDDLPRNAGMTIGQAFERAKTERNELLEALRPFARLADYYDPPEGDDNMTTWDIHAPLGDLRRARALIVRLSRGGG